ncbi:MAG: NmrA family transcriptional regulator [Paraburkholderia sp.]|uniref:NAD(P)H-binding protein n=1 Tax=Paraburkholderia sp. TaxID=1926495 RepID=UPI00122516FB|nr:NAD(P)H-binding protein [Paraburkholderia sp.]TAL93794.1 MAG: NmrA family transcriptional regulator [Paraburkholderia sp.]
MFVIFGATGHAGRLTAIRLREAGLPVRAVVRRADQAKALTAIGCEIAFADLMDPTSVAKAIEDAHAVQMICPVPSGHADPEHAMRTMIDVAAQALRANAPQHVLAISDYGAELDMNTGITRLFHYLEQQFSASVPRLTLLRSAEHMQNWSRVIPVALATGMLPSLHHPLTKRFPSVAAQDVGALAATLLREGPSVTATRIVSIEAMARVSPMDVARVLQEEAGREIVARELPRDQWLPVLAKGGLSAQHASLIVDLYDAHNAGHIDVEADVTERRFGATALVEVLAPLVRQAVMDAQ